MITPAHWRALFLLLGVAAWLNAAPPQEGEAAPVRFIASSSFLPIDRGPCGHNARVALEANGGALQRVEIAPGVEWSFNEAMGDPAKIAYEVCSGIPGGYWCDVAARYLQVGRGLGLEPTFQHHGIQLAGVDWSDSIAIWNAGGRGGQDLLLRNETGKTVFLWVEAADGGVIVRGR